jgi:hypothetical protein
MDPHGESLPPEAPREVVLQELGKKISNSGDGSQQTWKRRIFTYPS